MPAALPIDAFTHIFQRGPSARTLVLLHGTGGDENDLLPLGPMLDPSASVLSPRGRVLENGMPRFFKRFAEGVFDLDDVRRRALELSAWLDGASAHYGLDRANFVGAGFSNGANIASAMMIEHRSALAGAILIRAMHTIDPQGAPPPASSLGPAALLLTGDADPIVSAKSADGLEAALRGAGVRVDHRRVPAGHTLTRADVDAGAAWLISCPRPVAPS
jgi:phospholipase/carboxylesterase